MIRAALLRTTLERHGRMLGELAREHLAPGVDPPVPSCPGLAARELVRHVGAVHEVIASWIVVGRRPDDRQRMPSGGETLVDWQQERLDGLLAVLDDREPSDPCSTWCATDPTVGFWLRRAAHETVIHHLDLTQAVGVAWDVDPEVAVDGIREALDLWLGTLVGRAVGGTGAAVRVLVPGMRAASPALDRVVRPLERLIEHAPGALGLAVDATLAGSAAQVLAWSWGRDAGDLRPATEGDDDAVAAVRALLARAQQ